MAVLVDELITFYPLCLLKRTCVLVLKCLGLVPDDDTRLPPTFFVEFTKLFVRFEFNEGILLYFLFLFSKPYV